jgi:hypothetical protein
MTPNEQRLDEKINFTNRRLIEQDAAIRERQRHEAYGVAESFYESQPHKYISGAKRIRPPKPTQYEREQIIKAKGGYHGVIKHPTFFEVGERGAERVDITPVRESYFGFSIGQVKKAKSMKDFWWG